MEYTTTYREGFSGDARGFHVHISLKFLVRPDRNVNAVKHAGICPKRVMPNLKTVVLLLVVRLTVPRHQRRDTFRFAHLKRLLLPLLEIGGH